MKELKKRIFIDLDGVLADFIGGAAKFHGKDPSLVIRYGIEECWGLTREQLWSPLGYDFWVNLELTQEAHTIVSMCEETVGVSNVCILTSPCHTPGCTDGKRSWVEKHFPQYSKQLLIGSAKHFCASSHSLLIDDSDDKITAFKEAGGRVFLFPRRWNSSRNVPFNSLDLLKMLLNLWVCGDKGVAHGRFGSFLDYICRKSVSLCRDACVGAAAWFRYILREEGS